jgi:hypothetical protein
MTDYTSPAEAGVQEGDFFYASWGYDQTNITWFKVVGLTSKGVKVQEWSSKAERNDGGPVTYVVPGDVPEQDWDWDSEDRDDDGRPYRRDKKVKTKFLQVYTFQGQKQVTLNWKSYATLHLWDGKPKYETGAGWGH